MLENIVWGRKSLMSKSGIVDQVYVKKSNLSLECNKHDLCDEEEKRTRRKKIIREAAC